MNEVGVEGMPVRAADPVRHLPQPVVVLLPGEKGPMQGLDVLDRHVIDADEAGGRFTDDGHVVRNHLRLLADRRTAWPARKQGNIPL